MSRKLRNKEVVGDTARLFISCTLKALKKHIEQKTHLNSITAHENEYLNIYY